MNNGMTWAEFKNEAERQGVRDPDRIEYIDVSSDITNVIFVTRDQSGEVRITSGEPIQAK